MEISDMPRGVESRTDRGCTRMTSRRHHEAGANVETKPSRMPGFLSPFPVVLFVVATMTGLRILDSGQAAETVIQAHRTEPWAAGSITLGDGASSAGASEGGSIDPLALGIELEMRNKVGRSRKKPKTMKEVLEGLSDTHLEQVLPPAVAAADVERKIVEHEAKLARNRAMQEKHSADIAKEVERRRQSGLPPLPSRNLRGNENRGQSESVGSTNLAARAYSLRTRDTGRGDKDGKGRSAMDSVRRLGANGEVLSPNKVAEFQGVKLGNGTSMLRGQDITRLSYAVYRLVKLFRIKGVVDYPCGAHVEWMPDVVHQLEFEVPKFQYTGIDWARDGVERARARRAAGWRVCRPARCWCTGRSWTGASGTRAARGTRSISRR
jgi:hypothetical protein